MVNGWHVKINFENFEISWALNYYLPSKNSYTNFNDCAKRNLSSHGRYLPFLNIFKQFGYGDRFLNDAGMES